MRNAQPILDEVMREWREVDDVISSVSAKFNCGVEDVREGVESVVRELVSQSFLEVEKSDTAECVSSGVARGDTRPPDDDWAPLGAFYMRHGLPSELHIDLTNGCNEKCVHCYLPKGGMDVSISGITMPTSTS